MMDAESMDMVKTHLKLKNPIGDHPFYVFVATAGSKAEHDEEKLHNFLEKCLNNGIVIDGTSTGDFNKYKV